MSVSMQKENIKKTGWLDKLMPRWVTPNQLSVMRIFLSLAMLVLDINMGSLGVIILLGLASGFSDLMDGALARQRGLESKLGAFLDPLGDKIFAFVLAFIVWHRNWVSIYLLLSILLTEIHTLVIPLLVLWQRKNAGIDLWPAPKVLPNRLGKLKTFALAFSLGFIIIANWLGAVWLERFCFVTLYLGLILGLLAEARYFQDWRKGVWT